jgi:1,4-alpha-glucan branching enzyme
VPLAAAAGLALAAGLTGYAIRGGGSATPVAAETPESPGGSTTGLTAVAVADRVLRPSDRAVPTQFVLDSPGAARVSLVGDFNGWNPETTRLVRDSSSGIWTATVALPPGRHVYAFMVDGTAWTLDPRAPTAQDPDFGTPSSVVLVGTP